jgi:hypothetical protein
MKIYGEFIYIYLNHNAFLVLALNVYEGSASLTGHFIPRERACHNHWIGDWLGSGLAKVWPRR